MQTHHLVFILSLLILASCKTPDGQTHSANKQNHLANESSPYLLQHANNPVDWYPWGEEALTKAKAENKLIIVSVGYAACHWCHVMEHESFEDTTVSKIMNEHFVAIKVDREERPDIDDVYMTACHLATGNNCGWPLNAFALPDGRPVWAGTYFPKKEWLKVMEYFIDLYQKEPEKLEEYARDITKGIQSSEEMDPNPQEQSFEAETIQDIAGRYMSSFDIRQGGRKGAPKFPMPSNHDFLMRYYHKFKDPKALEIAKVTLDEMAKGGIYDQLGGGFARYSVDAAWKVPHFEKMLYDNGQLVSLYANAYKLTKDPLYKQTLEETLTFIDRELTDENGGFYSSLDADSEGEEGKFYVWTEAELITALPDEKMRQAFFEYFEIKKKGNWEHEKNILHRREALDRIAKKTGLTETEIPDLIAAAKKILLPIREERVRPGLDDKVLTGWNALMLKGYVDAYEALGDQTYLDRALKNAQFILKEMKQSDHRLNRNYKDGRSVINGFLDDYALTIDAFVALYQVTFDERWLTEADHLCQYVLAHFQDADSGLFNYTSDIDPPLIARKKEVADNVIPASNSVMARNLHQLGTLLYKPDYIERARLMLHTVLPSFADSENPSFYSNWCALYLEVMTPPYEIAIVGDQYAALRNELMTHYIPDALYLGGAGEGSLELLEGKLQEGETMIYVCQNKVCKFPVTETAEALKLLDDRPGS